MEYQEFQNYFQEKMSKFIPLVESQDWQDKSYYATYLMQTFGFTSKSFELLKSAGLELESREHPLGERFKGHSEEEYGHENIALKDLRALGFSKDQTHVFADTEQFINIQFEYIKQFGGHSIFGYILLLETLAVTAGKNIFSKVNSAYGKTASNFLRVHVEEDEQHILDAWNSVKSLTSVEIGQVFQNFEDSLNLYTKLLTQCGQLKLAS